LVLLHTICFLDSSTKSCQAVINQVKVVIIQSLLFFQSIGWKIPCLRIISFLSISSYFAAFKFLSIKNWPIIQHTRSDVQLLRVSRVSFQHPGWKLLLDQNLQLLTESFNSKVASSEKTISKKSWDYQFFHHEFAKFHTTIKIIFVQFLYQINFIRMKLDFFFQNSLPQPFTRLTVMLFWFALRVLR